MNSTYFLTRDTCQGLPGNSDLYGLGIRIGIYLQWTSSLLTNTFLPDGAADLLDANSIFLFAVFIATANATSSPEALHPVEAFIMLALCFGYLLSVLSVTGLRLILLNDRISELSIIRSRLSTNLMNGLSGLRTRDLQSGKDLFALEVRKNYWDALRSELSKKMVMKPPGVSTSRFNQLRVLNRLAFFIGVDETIYGESAVVIYLVFSVLDPFHWGIDFFVFLCLARLGTQETDNDPVKSYYQERLLNYKKNRKLSLEYRHPQILSLGLSSIYKDDQVSWLGVVWRSLIVAGVGIYNTWFWFAGIEFLRTDTCPSYIFLFCKVNMLGRARKFNQAMSVIYTIYGGALLLSWGYIMLKFIETTFKSLLVNLIIMPCAKVLLLAVSTCSKGVEGWLEIFDATRSEVLKWLEIPNIRQMLCGFAYLSSNPKEAILVEEIEQNEEVIDKEQRIGEPSGKSVW